MTSITAYHQLGKFIADFQHLEESLNDLIELLCDADSEAVKILAHELEFSKRVKTTDALYSRFVSIRNNTDAIERDKFHKLCTSLQKLAERRNELVHSKYNMWTDVDDNKGLLRRHSKLDAKAGGLASREEELQPHAFDGDIERLAEAAQSLEEFRLAMVDYRYPV